MNAKILHFIKGYLSHLVLIVGSTVTTIVNVKHIGLRHLTHNDLTLIANSVWAAVVTNGKKVLEPALDTYLKRKYPGLGIIIANLEAQKNAVPVQQVPGDPLPGNPTTV